MEKLTTSHDLEKIISLYEAESKRKSGVFSSIIDKVKSLFSKEIISPQTTPSSISPVTDFYSQPVIEQVEEQEINTVETVQEDQEFNLESLQEFFKQNLSKEQEDVFGDLFNDEKNQLESQELNLELGDLEQGDLEQISFEENQIVESMQHSQPEFSSSSYFQRIQKHAALESKNEQLWRRRQAILNGDGSSGSSSESSDSLSKK